MGVFQQPLPLPCLCCPTAAVHGCALPPRREPVVPGGAWRNLLFPLLAEQFLKLTGRAQMYPPDSHPSGEPEAQVICQIYPLIAVIFESAFLDPLLYN